MNNAITKNGENRNYQPAKVLSIPISGIYSDVENNTVFLFSLTYARNGKTILFDVRRPSTTSFVNEYHLSNSSNNYVYYKVTENSIDVYVNLMLHTSANVKCLSTGLNVNIKYYSYENYTEESLTPANIEGFGKIIKNSIVENTTTKNTFAENLYCQRYNVDRDQQTITISLSQFLGSQAIHGYLKLVNVNATGEPRYGEYAITGSNVKPFNQSPTNINIAVDTTAKTITVTNLARGGLTVQYQPIYKIS